MKPYILLVESHGSDIEFTQRALADSRIANDVVVLRDGEQACEFLFGRGCEDRSLPAMVLLDLKLPKVSGLELLDRIGADQRTRHVRTVILTASKQEEDLLESRGLGTNSYLRKPVDFSEFVEAVRQVGLYWLVLNEAPPTGS